MQELDSGPPPRFSYKKKYEYVHQRLTALRNDHVFHQGALSVCERMSESTSNCASVLRSTVDYSARHFAVTFRGFDYPEEGQTATSSSRHTDQSILMASAYIHYLTARLGEAERTLTLLETANECTPQVTKDYYSGQPAVLTVTGAYSELQPLSERVLVALGEREENEIQASDSSESERDDPTTSLVVAKGRKGALRLGLPSA